MDAAAARTQPAPAPDRAAFETFLYAEARLLDARRFRDWMALFAEDGTYWVPAAPDQKSPFDHVSLFYDDRDLMKTRIDRLEHPRIHIQTPPSRTVHLVGNVMVEEADDGEGPLCRELDRDHGGIPRRPAAHFCRAADAHAAPRRRELRDRAEARRPRQLRRVRSRRWRCRFEGSQAAAVPSAWSWPG